MENIPIHADRIRQAEQRGAQGVMDRINNDNAMANEAERGRQFGQQEGYEAGTSEGFAAGQQSGADAAANQIMASLGGGFGQQPEAQQVAPESGGLGEYSGLAGQVANGSESQEEYSANMVQAAVDGQVDPRDVLADESVDDNHRAILAQMMQG
jgi:hypothetical protein